MGTVVRRGTIAIFLLVAAACGSAGPESPTAPSQPTAIPSQTPLGRTDFPPLSGPSRTFVFDRDLSNRVSEYTKTSRVTLYDNGAFLLQYPSLGDGGYRGAYTVDNGAIAFEWEGWSAAGSWGATGTLEGDSLTIRYNLIMLLTDFEDAGYVLVR